MIRELHVYGNVRPAATAAAADSAQHRGIGKMLLARAEEIARASNCEKIAVISGIGVREYYRKRGYTLRGTYMIKDLADNGATSLLVALLVFYGIWLIAAVCVARGVWTYSPTATK
jgi:GNAT superfamily N-acetyltransferase